MADSAGEEETGSGKLSGTQNLVVDDDFREMAKKAAWSVSSGKPGNGVLFLRDDNLDTYWQSDGAQPHLVNIQFQKKVKLQLLVLYVDFKIDESYTPSKIAIRAGDGFHNLKMKKILPTVLVIFPHSTVRHLFHFHASTCCSIQSSEWKGHPCAPDQNIWASAESCSSSTISLYFTGIHNILNT